MTQRHDSTPITIVGGSATGLFAAERLARAGRPVTLLESADDWSPEPRTLIVTRRMRDLLGEVGDRSVVNTISRFELVTAGRTASVGLSEPDLIIERAVLVPGLVELAEAAGVDLCMGSRVSGLTATDEGVTLEVGRRGATEERKATTVIGADGTFSRVARAGRLASIDYRPPRTGHCQAAVRLGTRYRAGLVPTGRYALFLLAHSRVS